MSGVISEFMIAAQPTLERMAYAFHQLKQDRDMDHQRVADMLLELHAERDHKNRTNLEADDIGMARSSISRIPRCDSPIPPVYPSATAQRQSSIAPAWTPPAGNPDSRTSPWRRMR